MTAKPQTTRRYRQEEATQLPHSIILYRFMACDAIGPASSNAIVVLTMNHLPNHWRDHVRP